jgi:predicted aspartyl protease
MRDRMKFCRALFLAFVLALALVGCQTTPPIALVGDRLRLNAKINGHSVQLVFDTGADEAILLRPTAERLGLKITEPPAGSKAAPGTVLAGITEPCFIQLLGTSLQGQFRVFEVPPGVRPDEDGLLAWQNLRNYVLVFHASPQSVEIKPTLPDGVGGWTTLRILKDSAVLGFEATMPNGQSKKFMIDTGAPGGISLSPSAWRAWRAAHPHAPVTLSSYYVASVGLGVSEVAWADEIAVGTLTLKNVPISGDDLASNASSDSSFVPTLGLYALSRMDLVVDGKWGVAYAQPNDSPPRPFNHNRLGAVFMPHGLNSNELIARVLPGTPAYEAGLRDGDVLLRAGDYDATHWRTPGKDNIVFWEQPAGTKVEMTLQRDGKEYHTTAVLRDLIGPGLNSGAP